MYSLTWSYRLFIVPRRTLIEINLLGGEGNGDFLGALSNIMQEAIIITDLPVPGLDVISNSILKDLQKNIEILKFNINDLQVLDTTAKTISLINDYCC